MGRYLDAVLPYNSGVLDRFLRGLRTASGGGVDMRTPLAGCTEGF